MELNTLRYFLAVAEEGNMTRAAEKLLLTQPMLSRQIKGLEEELGTVLFLRANKKMVLTDSGNRLRIRAMELLELSNQTSRAITQLSSALEGEVRIGCAETASLREVAKHVSAFLQLYPSVHVSMFSGIAENVTERLEREQLDVGIIIGPAKLDHYHTLLLSNAVSWGLLMKKDHPLAALSAINPQSIAEIPLIVPQRSLNKFGFIKWCGIEEKSLQIVATYTLVYNAALLTASGVGCTLCLDNLIHTDADTELCFRPLQPSLKMTAQLIWKRGASLSPAAMKLIELIKKALS